MRKNQADKSVHCKIAIEFLLQAFSKKMSINLEKT